MTTYIRTLAAIVFISVSPILAQEPASPASPRPTIVPLKLNIIVSKYQGDKKTSSLPYTLSLTSSNTRVNARMGAQIPLASTGGSSDGKPSPKYTYRDVGLFIDATAFQVDTGQFRVDVTVVDTTIIPTSQVQGAPAILDAPIFRNLTTHNSIVLRDGQTAQLTTAADPLSGEVMRVDVTLNVLK
jgi:hypothetical protein